jgi:L-serine dehydratase
MQISIFDLFKIGIGPSSSHTVGPMKAAKRFLLDFLASNALDDIANVKVELFGSLASTGKGHNTNKAVLLGLIGENPKTIDTDKIAYYLKKIISSKEICLLNKHKIPFIEERDIVFNKKKSLPEHPNGMIISLYDHNNNNIFSDSYFSVGGGFIVNKEEFYSSGNNVIVPYPFENSKELIACAKANNLSISELIFANEKSFHSIEAMKSNVLDIWKAMKNSVRNGCHNRGILPGGLNVTRRAPELYQKLTNEECKNDPLLIFDWVSLFALAVNEENAAGGKIVTSPTNGASGIIPAILHYYEKYYQKLDIEELLKFFFTAGAVGLLYKKNASISGAEMGCQGEVGVACSMAAAGLTALLGGSNNQIECSAEIGMEHNLGLTCDPIKGLVQIPCIERNTMGSIKAINASRLAIRGDGIQKISLDKVIRTMKQTGNDMKARYKETSRGGLAINIIEC